MREPTNTSASLLFFRNIGSRTADLHPVADAFPRCLLFSDLHAVLLTPSDVYSCGRLMPAICTPAGFPSKTTDPLRSASCAVDECERLENFKPARTSDTNRKAILITKSNVGLRRASATAARPPRRGVDISKGLCSYN